MMNDKSDDDGLDIMRVRSNLCRNLLNEKDSLVATHSIHILRHAAEHTRATSHPFFFSSRKKGRKSNARRAKLVPVLCNSPLFAQ